MKAIGYIRVSTQGQVNDGVSMEAQEAKIKAWAELNGYWSCLDAVLHHNKHAFAVDMVHL